MAADHASENTEKRSFLLKMFSTDIMTLIWYFIFAWIPIVAFIRIKECVVAIIGLHVQ